MITGEQFNKEYKDYKFVKLTKETEIHNGFQFQTGLNIDHVKFNPAGSCSPGGIYFTDYNKYILWLSYGNKSMYWMRGVHVPNDAQVYVEKNKFKADKIILDERRPIGELIDWSDNDMCKIAVQQNGLALQYVKNQTDEICKLAVQQNSDALHYVKNQTDEICKLAVQKYGRALQYVKNQTDEICKLAVQQNGYALQYVENQTDEICKFAVQQNGNALNYVKPKL
jgi:hypothetical protein